MAPGRARDGRVDPRLELQLDFTIHEGQHHGKSSEQPIRSTGFHPDRAAGRHRHHRGPDRAAAAGRAVGARGRPPRPVHQQPQAARPGRRTTTSAANNVFPQGIQFQANPDGPCNCYTSGSFLVAHARSTSSRASVQRDELQHRTCTPPRTRRSRASGCRRSGARAIRVIIATDVYLSRRHSLLGTELPRCTTRSYAGNTG